MGLCIRKSAAEGVIGWRREREKSIGWFMGAEGKSVAHVHVFFVAEGLTSPDGVWCKSYDKGCTRLRVRKNSTSNASSWSWLASRGTLIRVTAPFVIRKASFRVASSSVCTSFRQSIRSCDRPSVRASVRPSAYVCPPACPFICPSVCPSVFPSYLTVCLPVCPTVSPFVPSATTWDIRADKHSDV